MRKKAGLRSGGRKEEFGKPQPVVRFLICPLSVYTQNNNTGSARQIQFISFDTPKETDFTNPPFLRNTLINYINTTLMQFQQKFPRQTKIFSIGHCRGFTVRRNVKNHKFYGPCQP